MGEDSARLGAGQHAGLRILLIAGDPGGPFEMVPRELREIGVVLMNLSREGAGRLRDRHRFTGRVQVLAFPGAGFKGLSCI